jgi:pimeloyl-ACP methyl ester carboxylesterase
MASTRLRMSRGETVETQAQNNSAEQFVVVGDGVSLCYRLDGDAGRPALVLVAGLGQQLNEWPPELVNGLLAEGFRVLRFDNRDVGRSSRIGTRPPTAWEMLARRFSDDQYVLGDMALDLVGLLDSLKIEAAHLVGMSLGGMIAQTVAARHPQRVLTLTSVMSTTGARRVGRPTPGTYLRLFWPEPCEREAAAESTVAMMRHIGSRGFHFDAERVRSVAQEAWDRNGGPNPHGPARQLAAIFKSGDRSREVGQISAPTLVIHGGRDPMIASSGGWATSCAIPRSRLLTIKGLGHDLPAGACPELVDAISDHARAGRRRRESEHA